MLKKPVKIVNGKVIPAEKLCIMQDTMISIAQAAEGKLALPEDQYILWYAKANHEVESHTWTEDIPWFGGVHVGTSYTHKYYLHVFVILYRMKYSRPLRIKYLSDQVVITPDELIYRYLYLGEVMSQTYSREKMIDFIVREFKKPFTGLHELMHGYENGIRWLRIPD
ncbi:MAG: hypothetical protein Q8P17_04485 [bacterium]|nr:hypothetical protein [bacterium]